MAIDPVADHVKALARQYDYRLIREDWSRLSVSRYLSFRYPQDDNLWFVSKSAWRRVAETGLQINKISGLLTVRLTDHRGYAEGTHVAYTIRIDEDLAPQYELLDQAMRVYADVLAAAHPPVGR